MKETSEKNQRPKAMNNNKKRIKIPQDHMIQHESTLIMLGCETRIILFCRFVFLVNFLPQSKTLIINISG